MFDLKLKKLVQKVVHQKLLHNVNKIKKSQHITIIRTCHSKDKQKIIVKITHIQFKINSKRNIDFLI